MRTRHWLIMVAITCCFIFSSGCELANSLAGGEVQFPTVDESRVSADLLKYPKTENIAAFFCPDAFGTTLCTPALGASPAKEDMRFDFEITIPVQNPNSIAIPTLSMLLATTLFEGEGAEELGAVCVAFCDPNDPSCSGQGAREDCRADEDDTIDSFDDFVDRTTENLVNIATGTENAYEDNVKIKTIPAKGESNLKVVFSLGVDPMTNILEQVAGKYIDGFLSGAGSSLSIPYSMQGTVWFDLPFNYGRFGHGFQALDQVWTLD